VQDEQEWIWGQESNMRRERQEEDTVAISWGRRGRMGRRDAV
jgi:hypothetical protein